MFTNYDRQQQARERRALEARRELAAHEKTGEIVVQTDWNAAFSRVLADVSTTSWADDLNSDLPPDHPAHWRNADDA